mmetsp:Transcript_127629/g.330841  ORF Transcript_127629/g.330841 Transcript_127629/m.330841 type:complete len:283 (+) Transcript_127629:1469-2317(+)
MHHSSHHLCEAHIDYFTISHRGHVAESDCGENGEDEVKGVEPLIFWLAAEERSVAGGVHSTPRDPRLVRIVVQRCAKVPTASEEVHHPDQANTAVQDADPSEVPEPSPIGVFNVEGSDLCNASKPSEPCQPRDALQSRDAGDSRASCEAGFRNATITVGDGIENLLNDDLRRTCNEIDGKVTRQIICCNESHAVNLYTLVVAISKEEIQYEVYPEQRAHNFVQDTEGIAICIERLWDVELNEGDAVQEVRAGVNKQQANHKSPNATEDVALAHYVLATAVVT